MNRYWIRITLGAIGIFALGMVLVQAGRKGVSRVRQLVMNQTVTLPGDVAPFRVDRQRLGIVRQVSVTPRQDEDFPLINLTVAADSQAGLAELEHCVLLVRDADQIRSETGLHCAELSMPEREKLREVGQVTFEPGGEKFSIYTPADDHAIALTGTAASPAKESFRMLADGRGAFLEIRDKTGRPVFQLNADSLGASLTVRDSNGREVVRFKADSNQLRGHLTH
ncbi:MAG: hypothetical protein ABI613_09770 [Gemmatimonadota bacterium]